VVCPRGCDDGGMDDAAAAARRMWTLFEPVHVVTYFSPEGRDAFEAAGLRGFWRGYFAGRAAPLGRTGAAPVVASFFVFAPAMVSRAIPAVRDLAAPAAVLAARQAGAVAAVGRLLGLPAAGPVPAEVRAAADGLMAAATGLEQAGRPLAAANIALPVPEEPLARLWHAATLLREHRGDGHVAALVAAGLDGAEALALRIGTDQAGDGSHVAASWGREQMQPARGWTDAQWDAAAARLAARGLLDHAGAATAAGIAVHQEIELATDRAAARPWAQLGRRRTAGLAAALQPVARACAQAMPFPNPVGVPPPAHGPAPAG
jgi:hypothetical protein